MAFMCFWQFVWRHLLNLSTIFYIDIVRYLVFNQWYFNKTYRSLLDTHHMDCIVYPRAYLFFMRFSMCIRCWNHILYNPKANQFLMRPSMCLSYWYHTIMIPCQLIYHRTIFGETMFLHLWTTKVIDVIKIYNIWNHSRYNICPYYV